MACPNLRRLNSESILYACALNARQLRQGDYLIILLWWASIKRAPLSQRTQRTHSNREVKHCCLHIRITSRYTVYRDGSANGVTLAPIKAFAHRRILNALGALHIITAGSVPCYESLNAQMTACSINWNATQDQGRIAGCRVKTHLKAWAAGMGKIDMQPLQHSCCTACLTYTF
jgi:hypothetical protein